MDIPLVQVGRKIVDELLLENEWRSNEIIAGIDGERFHTHDMEKIVRLLCETTPGPELIVAAMGHDVERFCVPGAGAGYIGVRSGPAYEAYKKNHAIKSAAIIAEKLREKEVDTKSIDRISFLITHHDDTDEEIRSLHDEELDILVAADTLSWLNFSAPNYFNGKETRGIPGLVDKMNFMLRKLPEKYWRYISQIELSEPKVRPYLEERMKAIAEERQTPLA
jgi:hypothetical protein